MPAKRFLGVVFVLPRFLLVPVDGEPTSRRDVEGEEDEVPLSRRDADGEGFELPMLGNVDGEDLLEEEGVFGAVMTRPERKTWPSVTSAPLRS